MRLILDLIWLSTHWRFVFELNNDLNNSLKVFIMSQVQLKLAIEGADSLPRKELVARDVKSLRHGVMKIIVQDTRVFKIGKTERVRLDHPEHRWKTITA
jgi:hypothetical protein